MKYLLWFLSILLAYIPFIKPYGALDSVYPELLYIAITQFIVLISINLYRKQLINPITGISFYKILISLFLLWSFVSIIFSYNPIEGIVDWLKNFIFMISIINLSLIYGSINDKRIFFYTFLILLSIESIYIFSNFLEVYNFYNPPVRDYSFIGFTSNLNVSAYSILIKIPIVIYLFIKEENFLIKFWSLFLVQISIFNLFIISSRSSILTLGLIFFLLVILCFYILYKRVNEYKFFIKKTSLLFLITFLTILFHTILYKNSDDIRLDKRITSFDVIDQRSSYNFRLGFYKEAIQGFLDKPIFGHGIGNWKILSVKYGSERIREYQVPYHAHNDFLQMFAETGFIGGLLYFLIYFTPFFILIKKILRGIKNKKIEYEDLALFLAFIVFICDSMFNFPRARAISMGNLIFLYSYFISKNNHVKQVPKYLIKTLKSRVFLMTSLIMSIITIFSFYKLYVNSKQQVILIQDFNFIKTFKRNLNFIESISHEFPTLTHTSMSLSGAKANYYRSQGKIKQAKKLYHIENKKNQFLGAADIGLANIYIQESKLDSAYFFSRRSLKKLPYNQFHIATHQKVLSLLNNKKYLNEADSIFNKVKDDDIQAIWENHLLLLISNKHSDSFNQSDKDLVREAIKKYTKLCRGS